MWRCLDPPPLNPPPPQPHFHKIRACCRSRSKVDPYFTDTYLQWNNNCYSICVDVIKRGILVIWTFDEDQKLQTQKRNQYSRSSDCLPATPPWKYDIEKIIKKLSVCITVHPKMVLILLAFNSLFFFRKWITFNN